IVDDAVAVVIDTIVRAGFHAGRAGRQGCARAGGAAAVVDAAGDAVGAVALEDAGALARADAHGAGLRRMRVRAGLAGRRGGVDLDLREVLVALSVAVVVVAVADFPRNRVLDDVRERRLQADRVGDGESAAGAAVRGDRVERLAGGAVWIRRRAQREADEERLDVLGPGRARNGRRAQRGRGRRRVAVAGLDAVGDEDDVVAAAGDRGVASEYLRGRQEVMRAGQRARKRRGAVGAELVAVGFGAVDPRN